MSSKVSLIFLNLKIKLDNYNFKRSSAYTNANQKGSKAPEVHKNSLKY